MDLIKDKVDKFQVSCYEMARSKAKEISLQVDEKLLNDTEDEAKKYEIEAKNNFDKKMAKLDHAYNTEIFSQQNESKIKILKKQQEIKEDLENEVISNIIKFVSSRKYITFLLKNITQAISNAKVGKKDKVKIYVTSNDFEKYEKKLEKEFKFDIIKIDNKNLGGSKCLNESKNILVDNTLKTLISEECNG